MISIYLRIRTLESLLLSFPLENIHLSLHDRLENLEKTLYGYSYSVSTNLLVRLDKIEKDIFPENYVHLERDLFDIDINCINNGSFCPLCRQYIIGGNYNYKNINQCCVCYSKTYFLPLCYNITNNSIIECKHSICLDCLLLLPTRSSLEYYYLEQLQNQDTED